jgi:hypothetical protein
MKSNADRVLCGIVCCVATVGEWRQNFELCGCLVNQFNSVLQQVCLEKKRSHSHRTRTSHRFMLVDVVRCGVSAVRVR